MCNPSIYVCIWDYRSATTTHILKYSSTLLFLTMTAIPACTRMHETKRLEQSQKETSGSLWLFWSVDFNVPCMHSTYARNKVWEKPLPSSYTRPCLLRAVRSRHFLRPWLSHIWTKTTETKWNCKKLSFTFQTKQVMWTQELSGIK